MKKSFLTEAPIIDESSLNPIIEIPSEHDDIIQFIKNCYTVKPKGLKLDEITWKYLVRNVIRGENTMIVGHSGTGKTIAAKMIQSIFPQRQSFIVNMGSTQDARTALIGSTQFKKELGTYFNRSYFIKAITTPNAIVLLDEISRAHPEAWNILMSVVDPLQRYIRLDEQEDSPTIDVAPGVSFISTANIGMEYTSARRMDKAFFERWTTIEMPILQKDEEFDLLKYLFPSVGEDYLEIIACIANDTRRELLSENSKLSKFIATRQSIKMAGLLFDGFSLEEAINIIVYPLYSSDGGNDSERVYAKQLAQKYINAIQKPDDTPDMNMTAQLFTPDDLRRLAAS